MKQGEEVGVVDGGFRRFTIDVGMIGASIGSPVEIHSYMLLFEGGGLLFAQVQPDLLQRDGLAMDERCVDLEDIVTGKKMELRSILREQEVVVAGQALVADK